MDYDIDLINQPSNSDEDKEIEPLTIEQSIEKLKDNALDNKRRPHIAEKDINRRRDKAITIRMTQEEYELFCENFENSDFDTKQNFVINSISRELPSDRLISEVAALAFQVELLYSQLRGIATNVNQIAKHTNQNRAFRSLSELDTQTAKLRGEVYYQWQSIKSQLQSLQVTQR